jgi:hypothetical protein
MKKRSKNKSRTSKPVAAKKARTKKYEAHYLAIVLIAFLLLEGTLISSTQAVDWQTGTSVLDLSFAVAQTSQDLAVAFSPVTNTIEGVNQFYALATDQMMGLLDLSGTDPLNEVSLVADGVNSFYQQAATQMAQVLDMPSMSSWPGNVAGISTTVY